MSFIFSRPSPQPSSTPLPPAPVQIARSTELSGDAVIQAERDKQRRRGSAGARRGLSTILSGDQTQLGATTGKTLLGA